MIPYDIIGDVDVYHRNSGFSLYTDVIMSVLSFSLTLPTHRHTSNRWRLVNCHFSTVPFPFLITHCSLSDSQPMYHTAARTGYDSIPFRLLLALRRRLPLLHDRGGLRHLEMVSRWEGRKEGSSDSGAARTHIAHPILPFLPRVFLAPLDSSAQKFFHFLTLNAIVDHSNTLSCTIPPPHFILTVSNR